MKKTIVTICLIFWMCNCLGQYPHFGSEKRKDTSITGILGKKTISIPTSFLLGPVSFAPETKESNNEAISYRRITDVSILLRLSSMQPIRDEKDLNDWNASFVKSDPIFYEEWTVIEFDARSTTAVRPDFKNAIARDSANGPFVETMESAYGLQHYVSTRVRSPSPGMGWFEYFSDSESGGYVVCETTTRQIPPFKETDQCHQFFWVPEVGLTAEATYTKKSLYKWKQIKSRVRALINERSF